MDVLILAINLFGWSILVLGLSARLGILFLTSYSLKTGSKRILERLGTILATSISIHIKEKLHLFQMGREMGIIETEVDI